MTKELRCQFSLAKLGLPSSTHEDQQDNCAHDAKIIRRPMKRFMVISTGRVNVKKKSHGGGGASTIGATGVPECEVHYAQGGLGCASFVRTISFPIWL